MHSIQTLLKLSKNPHYKMTPEQLKELERYRNEQFTKRNNGKPVKHSTSFAKHDPNLQQEKGHDANKATDRN